MSGVILLGLSLAAATFSASNLISLNNGLRVVQNPKAKLITSVLVIGGWESLAPPDEAE